jgi:hypothetical protein
VSEPATKDFWIGMLAGMAMMTLFILALIWMTR